jgi:hypothetical protein
MSQKIRAIEPLILEGVEITVEDHAVHFRGVISLRSPGETVTPFLRRVHDAVTEAGVKSLTVDITKLRFMNSSSIRSLVDWVEWIRGEPEPRQYVLHFVTKPDVLWHSTTLSAIQSFGGKHVVVHQWA